MMRNGENRVIESNRKYRISQSMQSIFQLDVCDRFFPFELLLVIVNGSEVFLRHCIHRLVAASPIAGSTRFQ